MKTYFRSEISLRPKLTTLDVNTTLENTVNRPAIPNEILHISIVNTIILIPLAFLYQTSIQRNLFYDQTLCKNSIINCHRMSYKIKRYRFP